MKVGATLWAANDVAKFGPLALLAAAGVYCQRLYNQYDEFHDTKQANATAFLESVVLVPDGRASQNATPVDSDGDEEAPPADEGLVQAVHQTVEEREADLLRFALTYVAAAGDVGEDDDVPAELNPYLRPREYMWRLPQGRTVYANHLCPHPDCWKAFPTRTALRDHTTSHFGSPLVSASEDTNCHELPNITGTCCHLVMAVNIAKAAGVVPAPPAVVDGKAMKISALSRALSAPTAGATWYLSRQLELAISKFPEEKKLQFQGWSIYKECKLSVTMQLLFAVYQGMFKTAGISSESSCANCNVRSATRELFLVWPEKMDVAHLRNLPMECSSAATTCPLCAQPGRSSWYYLDTVKCLPHSTGFVAYCPRGISMPGPAEFAPTMGDGTQSHQRFVRGLVVKRDRHLTFVTLALSGGVPTFFALDGGATPRAWAKTGADLVVGIVYNLKPPVEIDLAAARGAVPPRAPAALARPSFFVSSLEGEEDTGTLPAADGRVSSLSVAVFNCCGGAAAQKKEAIVSLADRHDVVLLSESFGIDPVAMEALGLQCVHAKRGNGVRGGAAIVAKRVTLTDHVVATVPGAEVARASVAVPQVDGRVRVVRFAAVYMTNAAAVEVEAALALCSGCDVVGGDVNAEATMWSQQMRPQEDIRWTRGDKIESWALGEGLGGRSVATRTRSGSTACIDVILFNPRIGIASEATIKTLTPHVSDHDPIGVSFRVGQPPRCDRQIVTHKKTPSTEELRRFSSAAAAQYRKVARPTAGVARRLFAMRSALKAAARKVLQFRGPFRPPQRKEAVSMAQLAYRDPFGALRSLEVVDLAPSVVWGADGTKLAGQAAAHAVARDFAAKHALAGAVLDVPEAVPAEVEAAGEPASVSVMEVTAALATTQRRDRDGGSARLLSWAVSGSAYIADAVAQFATDCLGGAFPPSWRIVMIRALQKPGRPRGPTTNLRPVGDIPMLRAVVEKVVAARAAEVVEPNLRDEQCGFRSRRGDDMATLALVDFVAAAQAKEPARQQRTAAGAGAKRKHRVLLLALDIKDAYPTMRPSRIVRELCRLGGSGLVKWVWQTVGDKSICVEHHGSVSATVPTPAGSTTGTADAPMEWTAYMDGLLADIERGAATRRRVDVDVMQVAVADDLTIAVSGPRVADIAAAAAAVLGIVSRWCAAANLVISPKSTALLVKAFARNKQQDDEDEWVTETGAQRPGLVCGGVQLPVLQNHATVKILGVLWDGFGRFTQHFEQVKRQMLRCGERMAVLGPALPPWQARRVYAATALAKAKHHLHAILAAASVDKLAFERLEAQHQAACRRCLGAVANCGGEAAVAESGLRSLKALTEATAVKRYAELGTLAAEMQARDPAASPSVVARRMAVRAARPLADQFVKAAVVASRVAERPIKVSEAAGAEGITFDDGAVPRGRVVDAQAKQEANTAAIARAPFSTLDVWTDGSFNPSAGQVASTAGAAFVVYGGDARHDDAAPPVAEGGAAVACPACSYTAEVEALLLFLAWLVAWLDGRDGAGPWVIVLFTDSQSALKALMCGPLRQRVPRMREVWRRLVAVARRGVRIHMTFVYSHVGNVKADRVDELAKAAAAIPLTAGELPWQKDVVAQATTAASNAAMSVACAGSLRGRHGQVGPTVWKAAEWVGVPSAEARLVAQVRTGNAAAIGGHLFGQDDVCPHCAATLTRGGGQAIDHVFSCMAQACVTARTRDDGAVSVRDLWQRPRVALEYLRAYVPAEKWPTAR